MIRYRISLENRRVPRNRRERWWCETGSNRWYRFSAKPGGWKMRRLDDTTSYFVRRTRATARKT